MMAAYVDDGKGKAAVQQAAAIAAAAKAEAEAYVAFRERQDAERLKPHPIDVPSYIDPSSPGYGPRVPR
jgi:hypothetical protein